MDKVSIEKARGKLGDIVNRASYARQATLITRNGEPAALVAPVLDDYSRGILAEADILVKREGDTAAAELICDLLIIIETLTLGDPNPDLPKTRSKK